MHRSESQAMATKTSMILGWAVGLVCGVLVAVAAFQVVDAFVSSDDAGTTQTILPAVQREASSLGAVDRADSIAANAHAGAISAEVAPAIDLTNVRSQDVADTLVANAAAAADLKLSEARSIDRADTIAENVAAPGVTTHSEARSADKADTIAANQAAGSNINGKGLGTTTTRH
jgi:hypothetical protein